jgi:hypothetical protein
MEARFFALLSAFGPAAVVLALVVGGQLSQRLGTVTRMPATYRWYYVGAGLVAASLTLRLLGIAQATDVLLLVYNTTYAVGVTIGVIVSWHYWAWLFGERDK